MPGRTASARSEQPPQSWLLINKQEKHDQRFDIQNNILHCLPHFAVADEGTLYVFGYNVPRSVLYCEIQAEGGEEKPQ